MWIASSLALAGCGEAMEAPVSTEPSASRSQTLDEGAVAERRIIVYQTTSLQLYTVDKKGNTQLLAQRSGAPVVSPDGLKAAYAKLPDTWQAGDPVVSAELYVFDSKSGKSKQLTRGHDDTEPVWTPDGSSLLFQSTKRSQMAALFKVKDNGKDLEQVTNVGGTRSNPSYIPNPASSTVVQWAPTERRIIVYSTTSLTNGDVRVIDFDRALNVESAYSLGEGYSPKWTEQGTVVYSRKNGTQVVEVEVSVD